MIEAIMGILAMAVMSWTTGILLGSIIIGYLFRNEIPYLTNLYEKASPTKKIVLYHWLGWVLIINSKLRKGGDN